MRCLFWRMSCDALPSDCVLLDVKGIYPPSELRASSLQLRFGSKEHGALLQRSGDSKREHFTCIAKLSAWHSSDDYIMWQGYVSSTMYRTFSLGAHTSATYWRTSVA